jgi:hypothetical protein
MAETVRIDGLEDVRRALLETPVELRKKVMYRLLRKAAAPIVRAARASAPVAARRTSRVIPGLLKRTLGVRRSKIKRPARGDFGVFITAITPPGIKRIKGRARKAGVAAPNFGDPFYHRFQEGGFHAVGRRRVGGGRRARAARLESSGARFIPGKKYLGGAYESRRRAEVELIQRDLVTESVAAFNRRAKK